MDDRHRVSGFDVNGFLANSKTNLISLLQPYQAPVNLTTASKKAHQSNTIHSTYDSEEDDEDDEFDDNEDGTSVDRANISASRVQHEIGRIYERRNYIGDFKSDLNTKDSNYTSAASAMESTSSKEAAIPRAYVRPAKSNANASGSTQLETTAQLLAPPLPLLRFSATDETEVASANTITGEKIRTIPNLIGPSVYTASVPLCDPMHTRKIAKWFVRRSFKESNLRQVESYSNQFGCSTAGAAAVYDDHGGKPEVLEHTVYESLLYAEVLADRRARDALRVPEEQLFQERYERALSAQTAAGASPSLTQNSSYKDLTSMPTTTAPAPGTTTTNTPPPSLTPSFQFDAEFECGNLEKAVRVVGRETLLPSPALEQARDLPGDVDQEYDLTLRKDINTDGNIQWYYFAVSTPAVECTEAACMRSDSEDNNHSCSSDSSTRPTPLNTSRAGAPLPPLSVPLHSRAATPLGGQYAGISGRNTPASPNSALAPVKYPLRVRFNIINMQKKDSLYNYGMMPCTYSVNQRHNEDWLHRGEDVCYYRNGHTTIKTHKKADNKKIRLQYHYTLTFTYTFEAPDTVYFAHTFPYTYSDLQLSLCKMEQKYLNSGFFHQRKLCETLAGNSCDILSISERSAGIIESKNKPAIVLTSRVHPGESNSSFMIQGFLDFITSDAPEAVKLRQSFVFHVIPMLNPDGVIHGNYRCSLAATDLNRRYGAPHPKLHPTILAKKNFLKSTAQNRSILLYLDLHGHSKLKNAFCYGCDVTLQNDKSARQLLPHMSPEDVTQRRVFSRVFPRVLGAVSNCTEGGYFSYRDCSYHVNKTKGGTGRVVCWREINIAASYTIEASFCGNGDNKECALFKKVTESAAAGNSNVASAFVKPSTAPANTARRCSSAATLPRFRPDGGAAAGLPPSSNTSGIAYFAVASDSAGSSKIASSVSGHAGEVDSDGEALGGGRFPFVDDSMKCVASDSPFSRNGKRKTIVSTKKEKARPMSHRKSSIATAGPSPISIKDSASVRQLPGEAREQSATPVGETDKALTDLLDRYPHFVHYRKEDLLKMGRDIGMAIFHFANLSHSDIEEELLIATRADAEAKAKARSLERINNYREANVSVQKNMPSNASSKGRKSTVFLRGDKHALEARQLGEHEEDPHYGHLQSAAWCPDGSGSALDERFDPQDPGIDVPNGDYDGLDIAIPSVAFCEEGQDGAEGVGEGNGEEVELDLEADDSDGEEEKEGEEELSCDDTGNKSAQGPSVRKGSPLKNGALDVNALVQEYSATKVRLMEYDMVKRSLLKAGVFSAAALETAMQEFPSEFITEQASSHVGMRMKCEYNIRRGLRCTEGIRLTDEVLRQHDAALTQPIEEDNMSTDGSDSNPSVDNVPATKMLKNIKKFKSNVGLVLALRKAAIRKKKKDMETDRKSKRKAARKLARQASAEKRALDEAKATQSAKEFRDAAALSALQQASATATAQQIAENLKEKVSRRKSSIFHSAPKHAPMYRYAPDEVKMSAQPLPMKVVNFRDYDLPEDGGPTLSRSRKGSESNYESQPQQQPPSSLPAQPSAHALALSMSTLTNAVNKLYFNAAEEPTPHSHRRTASHGSNSASTPILPSVAHSSSTADPPAPLPLFTASAIRREPLPSRAAPSTLPVQPTLHNMSSLVPVGPAEPLLRVRERHTEDSYGMRSFIPVSDAPPLVGRVRPKSGSATSSNRRRIN